MGTMGTTDQETGQTDLVRQPAPQQEQAIAHPQEPLIVQEEPIVRVREEQIAHQQEPLIVQECPTVHHHGHPHQTCLRDQVEPGAVEVA